MDKFLRKIKECRKILHSPSKRRKFWKENKNNFEKNVVAIIDTLSFPKKWRIYVTAGNFLPKKKVTPYDYDSWNSTFLVAATKRQGFEIIIFLNKARSEFLSLPAIIPLIVHESGHIKQAARSPQKYFRSYFNDAIAQKDEAEAELELQKLPQEMIDEAALESILYCFDKGGWNMAQKMANYLHKEQPEAYSGGYTQGMTKKQYQLFSRSKKAKDINILIDEF